MKKNKNEIVQAMAMVTQLGLSMLAPIVLCAFIGNWLDRQFGWSATAVLLILGVLAGARNTWMLLKQVADPEKKGRQDDQKNQ